MKLQTEEKELFELEELNKLKGETQKQATDRIRNELYAEKDEDLRRNTVMNYFFILTGTPMSLDQYNQYIKILTNKSTPLGYNIKSFIKDEKIKVDNKVLMQTAEELLKEQFLEMQVDKILSEKPIKNDKQ